MSANRLHISVVQAFPYHFLKMPSFPEAFFSEISTGGLQHFVRYNPLTRHTYHDGPPFD